MTIRPRPVAVSAVVMSAALAVTPSATTLALWTDQATVTARESTALSLASAPLTCVNRANSAHLSWAPVMVPAPLTYTATVDGRPLPVSDNASATVTPDLLLELLGKDVQVQVTGRLGDSSWVTVRSRTVRRTLLGLSVECRPEGTDPA